MPDPVRRGGVTDAGEAIAHRGNRRCYLGARCPRRHHEQIGRTEGSTDLEPWRQLGLESFAVEPSVGPQLELDPVQAPDLARADDGGRLADLVGRVEESLGADLYAVEAGRAGDLDMTVRCGWS